MQIASRMSTWGKPSKMTAADYVQDGLIAMWDGIENVGWGVHDANALVWVNLGSLGSSYNATRSSGIFLENGARFDHPFQQATTPQSYMFAVPGYLMRDKMKEEWSVDVCITPWQGWWQGYSGIVGNHGSNRGLVFGQFEPNLINFCVYQPLVQFGSISSEEAAAIRTPQSISMVASNTSATKGIFYRNGRQVSSVSTGNVGLNFSTNQYFAIGGSFYSPNDSDTLRLFDGIIHCVRIHNRALTADEIAANYAVDKARFNLP